MASRGPPHAKVWGDGETGALGACSRTLGACAYTPGAEVVPNVQLGMFRSVQQCVLNGHGKGVRQIRLHIRHALAHFTGMFCTEHLCCTTQMVGCIGERRKDAWIANAGTNRAFGVMTKVRRGCLRNQVKRRGIHAGIVGVLAIGDTRNFCAGEIREVERPRLECRCDTRCESEGRWSVERCIRRRTRARPWSVRKRR